MPVTTKNATPTENGDAPQKRHHFRSKRYGDRVKREAVGPLADPKAELIRRLDRSRRFLKKLNNTAEREDDDGEYDRLMAIYDVRYALINLIWSEPDMLPRFFTSDRVRSAISGLPTRDELLALVNRAESSSKEAQDELRRLLDEHEELWQVVGDVGRLLEDHLITILSGNSSLLREAISRRMATMRGYLSQPTDGGLESFVVDRVVITYLDLAIRQTRVLAADIATPNSRLERQLSRSHRRHLESVEALRAFRDPPCFPDT